MDRREFLAVSAAGMALAAMPGTGQASVENVGWKIDRDATAKLITDFSRSEAFPVNRYVQIGPASKQATKRFWFGWKMEQAHAAKAEWDVRAMHDRLYAQQAMTNRTKDAVSRLTDEASYAPGHVADVRSIRSNSGSWAESTCDRQDIRRSLVVAWQAIYAAAGGSVSVSDLRLVMNPATAKLVGKSEEVSTYLKSSNVKKGLYAEKYGLPDHYAAVEIVVEDAVQVATRRTSLDAREYVMPDGVAALVARPGGLEAPIGPTLSTLSLLVNIDMQAERKDGPEWIEGGIVDRFSAVVTSPVTGFLFKGIA